MNPETHGVAALERDRRGQREDWRRRAREPISLQPVRGRVPHVVDEEPHRDVPADCCYLREPREVDGVHPSVLRGENAARRAESNEAVQRLHRERVPLRKLRGDVERDALGRGSPRRKLANAVVPRERRHPELQLRGGDCACLSSNLHVEVVRGAPCQVVESPPARVRDRASVRESLLAVGDRAGELHERLGGCGRDSRRPLRRARHENCAGIRNLDGSHRRDCERRARVLVAAERWRSNRGCGGRRNRRGRGRGVRHHEVVARAH